MPQIAQDSLRTLSVGPKKYQYHSLPALKQANVVDVDRLPYTLKILLENLLRNYDNVAVTEEDIRALNIWLDDNQCFKEIAYSPARVLMQDFTGVPAIVDLAAMREALAKLGGNPEKINPLSPVDLIIDHSVQVDKYASRDAFKVNVEMEYHRNYERYAFLRWGQTAFSNFKVVPPGTGICHQVNLEYLGKVVWTKANNGGDLVAYPDTLVGTDSHTTMINGLGILGWGVGGIEAEAAMLGQPISMIIPEVIGFKLTGQLREGITATDLVLTVTEMLRAKGVVGKFVEFFGPGLSHLPLADRATISNMSPEFGATCAFFPVDQETLRYMRLTGRDEETLALVEAYCKAQGLWREDDTPTPVFSDIVELDLGKVEPCLAGPRRPQDRVALWDLKEAMDEMLTKVGKAEEIEKAYPISKGTKLHHGDVVIAAITSCTNTSNPSILMAAGLLAKKAVEKGLTQKSWVKTSLAPGSKVVTDYLSKAGLITYLEKLGFYLVGYGCTTCIGNSGPLEDDITQAISDNDLVVSAVLSGNRNFEGRVQPFVKANWLVSPPLVVAFALAGTTRINLDKEPLGHDASGRPVYLKDIWPTSHEIADAVRLVDNAMFRKEYSDVFNGDEHWKNIPCPSGKTYEWNEKSTYVQNPPFFTDMELKPKAISDIKNANILVVLGDSITTDHISPAGSIKKDSPAGKYLLSHGVDVKDFNSYGARRGNHEVMMRGTFANIRIRNEMLEGVEGGFTKYLPTHETLPIYDAAMKYQTGNTPLVVVAGKEYGTGSSRDWAAKGPMLLGVRAVLAESFERIHRSNLVGLGILPLEFVDKMTRKTLDLKGDEIISIQGLEQDLTPHKILQVKIKRTNGVIDSISMKVRIDTLNEVEYYRNGGILPYVIRNMLSI